MQEFFNFGTDGASSGEKKYYWDDINFGESDSRFSGTDINVNFTEGRGLQQIDLPVSFEFCPNSHKTLIRRCSHKESQE